jgi:hypothetical protein
MLAPIERIAYYKLKETLIERVRDLFTCRVTEGLRVRGVSAYYAKIDVTEYLGQLRISAKKVEMMYNDLK